MDNVTLVCSDDSRFKAHTRTSESVNSDCWAKYKSPWTVQIPVCKQSVTLVFDDDEKVGLTNCSASISKSKPENRKFTTQSLSQEIKKVPLKAELLAQFKVLQEEHEVLKRKYKSLEDTNGMNVEIIKNLKGTLEKSKDTKSKETQKETGLHLKCN